MAEVAIQDQKEFADDTLSVEQAETRKQLMIKLQLFVEKHQEFEDRLNMIYVLRLTPPGEVAKSVWNGYARLFMLMPFNKSIWGFIDQRVRPLTESGKQAFTAYFDNLLQRDHRLINDQVLKKYNLSEEVILHGIAEPDHVKENVLYVYSKPSLKVQNFYNTDSSGQPSVINSSNLNDPSVLVSTDSDKYFSADSSLYNFAFSIKDVLEQRGGIYRVLDSDGGIIKDNFIITIPRKSIKLQ